MRENLPSFCFFIFPGFEYFNQVASLMSVKFTDCWISLEHLAKSMRFFYNPIKYCLRKVDTFLHGFTLSTAIGSLIHLCFMFVRLKLHAYVCVNFTFIHIYQKLFFINIPVVIFSLYRLEIVCSLIVKRS